MGAASLDLPDCGNVVSQSQRCPDTPQPGRIRSYPVESDACDQCQFFGRKEPGAANTSTGCGIVEVGFDKGTLGFQYRRAECRLCEGPSDRGRV